MLSDTIRNSALYLVHIYLTIVAVCDMVLLLSLSLLWLRATIALRAIVA